ncbi:hypothetical protein, partial [Vibrio vulnificus]|uniref:hypothetical protein n=1 Tax=Vibrio vulnificus TaxID=672 RepID=UPI0024DFBC2E
MPADATGVKVTAQVTDVAGNASGVAEDTQGVDNVDAPTPTVEFQGIAEEGGYNHVEIGAVGKVSAKVTLADGTNVDDILVIKDGNGTELFNGKVTQEMLDNGYT